MTRGHLYLRAKPGRRDELLRALDELAVLAAKRRQPGFLGAEILLPFEDDERLLVWSSWASREHYERWLGDPASQEMLRAIRRLLAEEPVWRVYQVVDTIN
jgi:quinol monooxygenase YgiN